VSDIRVVVGVPAYEHAEYLPEALETLLGQRSDGVEIVLRDDCSSDDTIAIARRYASGDRRLHVYTGERRLGLAGNWWATFERARALHPQAEYFAWGSDHDVWHPSFVERLVAALDARPSAVLAYPRNVRIDAGGVVLREPWSDRDTASITDVRTRVDAAYRLMVPGDMVYGVMRAEALERARFDPVLVPDRLLLAKLAMQGEFVQVPQVLWRRRFVHPVTPERQRRALYPNGAPWWSLLPWWVPHVFLLARAAISEEPYPGLSRRQHLSLGMAITRIAVGMHARGQVNLAFNRLSAELAAPRNRVTAVALPVAQRIWRALPRRPR
jgi:hypothetical protein